MMLVLSISAPVWGEPAGYQPRVQHVEAPRAVQLPTLPPPVEVTSPSLTLQDAIQLAYRYQSNLAVARSQVQQAAGRTDQVAAARNPKLSLSSGYIHQAINRNSFPAEFGAAFNPNGWTHQATLSQLLFDFGHTRNLVRSAEEARKMAEAALAEYQSDLVLDVKRSYYAILQADRLVLVQENNIQNRRLAVQEARARFAGGLGLPSDVTRAETALATALFNLSQAQTDAAMRRLELNTNLGLDPRVRLTVREENETAPLFESPEHLFQLALDRRYELQRYRAAVESARAAVAAAQVQNAPSVGTSLAYQNRQNPFQETLGINLNIQFDVLDGGARNGKVRETEAALQQAEAELQGVQQKVMSEVGQAYLQLRNAEQQIAAAQAEESNASETLRLQEGRYRVGLGQFIDFADAQTATYTAQVNRVNAQTALDVARATLAQAIGEPIPK